MHNFMTALTISEALDQARSQLTGFDSARLDAEVLLCHVLGSDRSRLYAYPEVTLQSGQQSAFEKLIDQRQTGYPVAYLTGKKEFWSIELTVNQDTLIPRPDTECLLESVLDRIPLNQPGRIADLGSGSGAIAIAIASERPHCRIVATDINESTLAIARENAERLQLNQIDFIQSNWFTNVEGRFDVIVSNPPYISENDPHLLSGDIKHEPVSALIAGPDGLDAIRVICQQAKNFMNLQGWLLLEHGYDQADSVHKLLQENGFTGIFTRSDYAGHERVSGGQFKP